MKKYKCGFWGRKINALGLNDVVTIEVMAKDEEEALLKCYDTHEHISCFSAHEVKEENQRGKQ